jgi:hypothetical protein
MKRLTIFAKHRKVMLLYSFIHLWFRSQQIWRKERYYSAKLSTKRHLQISWNCCYFTYRSGVVSSLFTHTLPSRQKWIRYTSSCRRSMSTFHQKMQSCIPCLVITTRISNTTCNEVPIQLNCRVRVDLQLSIEINSDRINHLYNNHKVMTSAHIIIPNNFQLM